MANASIKFTKLTFDISDDQLTQVEVRWESDDPILCGHGARKTFHATVSVAEIISRIIPQISVGILTDKTWNIIR